MKTAAMFVFALTCGLGSIPALAQTADQPMFHATNVHDWTVNDPAPASRAFRTVVIVGVVGNRKITAEQLYGEANPLRSGLTTSL